MTRPIKVCSARFDAVLQQDYAEDLAYHGLLENTHNSTLLYIQVDYADGKPSSFQQGQAPNLTTARNMVLLDDNEYDLKYQKLENLRLEYKEKKYVPKLHTVLGNHKYVRHFTVDRPRNNEYSGNTSHQCAALIQPSFISSINHDLGNVFFRCLWLIFPPPS